MGVKGKSTERTELANEWRNRSSQQEAFVAGVNALASSAVVELRSKLATAVGSIPSVVASAIEFSSDGGPTASSLVFGSAVGSEHIVTATITVFCSVGEHAAATLSATAMSGEVRELGGDGEVFELPVECHPNAPSLRIPDGEFKSALRGARARLNQRARPV
jgi:hypothetical protein